MDVRAGLTPIDRQFADVVRRTGKPVVVVANKAEARAGKGAVEAYELGLGDPIPTLPEHTAPAEDDEDEIEDNIATRPIRVAVVGRPNVGKSTLINRLLGEERLLTGPEAGITRDT